MRLDRLPELLLFTASLSAFVAHHFYADFDAKLLQKTVFLLVFLFVLAKLLLWLTHKRDIYTDDLRHIRARAEAISNIDWFYDLLPDNPDTSMLKIRRLRQGRVISVYEYQWVRAARALSATTFEIVREEETPPPRIAPLSPVYHTEDIADWCVTAANGKIYGSYTMRAVIRKFKEEGKTPPPEVTEMESQLAVPVIYEPAPAKEMEEAA